MSDPSDPEIYLTKAPTFGRWLLTQIGRDDLVGKLAKAARTDRTFPQEGNPEAIRAHLRQQQVDGDMFQAVDDAEWDWTSS